MSLNLSDVVRAGDRVDLQTESAKLGNDIQEDLKYYSTRVHDLSDEYEDEIELLMPMEQTKLILIPVDAEFLVSFYAQKGIYGCKMRVKERYKQEGLFVLVMEQLTELEKQQRREYYRFDCVIGMNTRQLTDDEMASFNENPQFIMLPPPEGKSVIVDLSGGGMRFISADKYEPGHLIHCVFRLPVKEQIKRFETMLMLIATKPVPNNPNNTQYRGQFVELNSATREDIIKFIFEEQRKSRKKL